MKTRQDNDLIDRTYVIYTENDIELSWFLILELLCLGFFITQYDPEKV